MFRVLGIGSSIRKASRHQNLLRFAQKYPPTGVAVDLADLASLPLFNSDYFLRSSPPIFPSTRTFGRLPYTVEKFHQQLRDADAVLFAAAEFPVG